MGLERSGVIIPSNGPKCTKIGQTVLEQISVVKFSSHNTIFSILITETRNKALDKLEEIKSTDAFSKDLTDETVANVYDGFNETLHFSTFFFPIVW